MIRKLARRLSPRRAMPAGPWIRCEPQPDAPQPVDAPLFAIIGAYTEDDVIGATVQNAFVQGCEHVYIVDNASRDDTVARAEAAGAQLAETFATDEYDEALRLDIMNSVVRRVSEASEHDHIWWLWLDADEFPHASGGRTIREQLDGIDARFRIVGARFINHFPSDAPQYISGFHPLDFQPLCEEHRFGCPAKHRKHPLQRWDRKGTPIICDRGFHRAICADRPLLEPDEPLWLHHFPYRDPDVTRARLTMLCGADEQGVSRVREGDDAGDGMIPRFQTLDAVYRGAWANVRNYRNDGAFSVAQPVRWVDLAPASDQEPARWYSVSELDAAKRAGTTPSRP